MSYCMFEEIVRAGAPRSREARIQNLRMIGVPQVKALLDITYHPGIKWLVESGTPNYRPCDDSVAVMNVRLKGEMKKMINFLNVGPYPNLNPSKRAVLYQTVLEVVHPLDAKMLIFIKDYKRLPDECRFDKDMVAEAFSDLGQSWKEYDERQAAK